MEHNHRVQGVELGTHHTQVQPDDHRMEYHTKLENQESGDLLLEGAVASDFVDAVDFVSFGNEFLFVSGFGRGCGCGFDVGTRGALGRAVGVDIGGSIFIGAGVRFAGDGFLHVRVVVDAVFDFDIALCDEIEQEDYDDGGQDDGGTPGIVGPVARHAHACVGSNLAICRIEEMDECRSDDDTGAEVASEEVDIERDL